MALQKALQSESFVAIMAKHYQRALHLVKVAIVEVLQKALRPAVEVTVEVLQKVIHPLVAEVAIAAVLQKAWLLTKVAAVVVLRIEKLAMVEILPSYPFEVVDVAGLLWVQAVPFLSALHPLGLLVVLD